MIASNGVEAYRLAVKERPDAIIADYVMPEGGGHYLLVASEEHRIDQAHPASS